MEGITGYRKIGLQGMLLFLLLMTLAACSASSVNWNNLKFWQSQKLGATMDDKAVNRFVAKIRVQPGNPESHYLLASYYQERGYYREAIAEYEKVIAIDPSNVKAYNGKGICHDQLGEHRDAALSFEQAISLNGNLDYLWNNLCYSFLLQEKHEEAISACRKALALNERNNRIRNNLALAYALAGQDNQAFREFQTAGNGDQVYAHLKMGAVYYDKALFGRAAEHYRAAVKLNPTSDSAKKGLEASLALMKVAEAAQRDANKTAESNVTKGDSPADSAVAPNAVVDKAEADRQFRFARKLYEKGLFEEAKRHFQKALMANPDLACARRGGAAAEALARIAEVPSRNEAYEKTNGGEISDSVNTDIFRQAGIEVSNGNGKNHMARDIGKYLKTKGFNVVRLTNARNFNHARGSIYYQKDYRDVADEIAEKIPEISIRQEMKQSVRPNVKVKVVLGKDLVANGQAYCN